MENYLEFLKPRVGAVLAIVAVLIIQAYCDLCCWDTLLMCKCLESNREGMIRQFRNELPKTTWKSYCCLLSG